jgi:hypothetical protein
MPVTAARRHQDPDDEAKLLLVFIAVAAIAGVGYICYARLHIRKEQLMEASLYLLAAAFVFWDTLRYVLTLSAERENAWPHPPVIVDRKRDSQNLRDAFAENSIVIGYDICKKPLLWPDEVRVMQANGFGMTGAGKTTLLLNIIQQDLIREAGPRDNRHKVPLIIIDGKGEREFLDDKLLPLLAAAGRLGDLRIIDPSRPEISVRFNPFIAISGQYQEHVSFIFESFDLREDFFHGHQKTYLSDIVRILYYTGKRYNIYDILVMAYDLDVLKEQAGIARARIERLPDVSHQQRLNFQMSTRNLIESFSDPKRVQMIRGLINQMMTFLEDKLSIITGPYEDLISIEDVIEEGRILFVSLNTNKNDDTTRSRAIDAIRRHNQLVDNYNVMAEKQTKQNFAEQAAATSVVPASAGEQATKSPTQGESPLPEPELTSNSKANSAEQMTTQDAPLDQVKMTKQQYKALIEETKRNATRGSAQQVAALNQQVRNLRDQLNMALTRIEKYEKQNRSSVRA